MSSFSGLSIALSGLYAQRRGLDVTGQNIANANTEGYSRQRVQMQSVGGPTQPAIFSRSDGSGNGVRVTGTERLRDVLLEQRAQVEYGEAARLTGEQKTLDRIEQLFAEPGDNGIQTALGAFWSSWHDLANNPGDLAARRQVLSRADAVASSLRDTYTQLADEWSNARTQVVTVVDEVNATARGVADLNRSIQAAVQSGVPANELMDRRDQLVLTLSNLVGATSRSVDDGVVDVYVGGSALVRGQSFDALQVSGPDGYATGNPPVEIQWAKDGYPAAVSSGQAGSKLVTLNTTIPTYVGKVDGVAAALAGQVNALHQLGYDEAGIAGVALFSGTTSQTIAVAVSDPALVAAAGLQTVGGNLDGSNADLMALLGNDPARLVGRSAALDTELGSPARGVDQRYRALVVDLAVAGQSVARRLEVQANVVAQADADREAASGVNLDEEMVNMLQFQRAYEAASRVMTAVDAALDTLINRTGLVGR